MNLTSCISAANAPNFQGIDLFTGFYRTCTDPNCFRCPFDNRLCTACKPSTTPQYYLYNSTCILLSTLPALFGANNLTFEALRCSDPNCLSCLYDYAVCTRCNTTGSVYYLYQGLCFLVAALPAGAGAGPSPAYLGIPCLDTNCYQCNNDYTKCSLCLNTPVMYYQLPASQTCTLLASITDYNGASVEMAMVSYALAQPQIASSVKQTRKFVQNA